MSGARPSASLSLDLDNKWSYLKTHGDKQWATFPSYLDVVCPRVLEVLRKHDLKITFFIVGQDAALPENYDAIKSLADAGHEIGNHSFNHEPWLHLYSEAQIEAELTLAADHITHVTGQQPIGFRGPGYSLSLATLRVLKRLGYQYDCSTFPTFLGPLARAYYFMTAKLSEEEKQQRKKLFGTLSDGLRSNKPYCWKLANGAMPEIPVTTMPIFKIPIHFSYLLYLAVYSRPLALLYFRIALLLCGITGIRPSLLLHPLDFLGHDDTHDLDFFPAMRLDSAKKIALIDKTLQMFKARYRVLPMKAYADEVTKANRLRLVEPQFNVDERLAT